MGIFLLQKSNTSIVGVRRFTLNMVENPVNTTLWSQGWMYDQELGTMEDIEKAWDIF